MDNRQMQRQMERLDREAVAQRRRTKSPPVREPARLARPNAIVVKLQTEDEPNRWSFIEQAWDPDEGDEGEWVDRDKGMTHDTLGLVLDTAGAASEDQIVEIQPVVLAGGKRQWQIVFSASLPTTDGKSKHMVLQLIEDEALELQPAWDWVRAHE